MGACFTGKSITGAPSHHGPELVYVGHGEPIEQITAPLGIDRAGAIHILCAHWLEHFVRCGVRIALRIVEISLKTLGHCVTGACV